MLIKNYRCIKEEVLDFDYLTVLVGSNGAGKSTFLNALALFYDNNAKYSTDDFYNKDDSKPISITITYTNLTDNEKNIFKKYIQNELLVIEKEIDWPIGKNSQIYYGHSKRCSDFIKALEDTGTELRTNYKNLRKLPKYQDLEELSGNFSRDSTVNAFNVWELNHLDSLDVFTRDDGNLFGFDSSHQYDISKFTKYIPIPAVRDASIDASENRDSAISELLNIVTRNALEQRDDVLKLKEDTYKKYMDIIKSKDINEELAKIQKNLVTLLNTFAPGSKLHINWNTELEIQLPSPTANILIEEEDYITTMDHVGHGLQRAFIFSILQCLNLQQIEMSNQSESEESTKINPYIILGIEEVELYQHPTRQRHIARVLLELSNNLENGSGTFQIIYTTHSPLFVDLERFNQIRLVSRQSNGAENPKITKVYQTNLAKIVREKERIDNVPANSYVIDGQKARLKTLFTPWFNEGFFSHKVVLVEGEEDRAIIVGAANQLQKNLEKSEISIIPCNGKPNLPKAALIFKHFNIPIYVIWDGDRDNRNGHPDINESLLRLFNGTVLEYPDTCVGPDYSCFEKDITSVLRTEIGDFYDSKLEQLREEYGYLKTDDLKKNPYFIEQLLKSAKENGRESPTINSIIGYINNNVV
jgi:predicted ATP-dependent endonuclease of OLD family